MLAEYSRFPLFSTVGIDASFYGPLTEKTLRSYAAVLPDGFSCVSKVWDRLTVYTLRRGAGEEKAGEPNPDFLNADLFLRDVWTPCAEHFTSHLGPFVFEFQAIARQGRHPDQFAQWLDEFFGKLPREGRYAVEIRNPGFSTPAYFAVLQGDVAHVFAQLDGPGCPPSACSSICRVGARQVSRGAGAAPARHPVPAGAWTPSRPTIGSRDSNPEPRRSGAAGGGRRRLRGSTTLLS